MMKKTSQDSTLDFFDFFQKTFLPKFELLNSGCVLSEGFCGMFLNHVDENTLFPSTSLSVNLYIIWM